MRYKYDPKRHRKSYRWQRNVISLLKPNKASMTPEIFRRIEKLYHYTSLKNGTLILLSKTMIMSKPEKMNDINESFRPIYGSNCGIDNVFAEMAKYYQCSFTADDGRVPGFAIPAMWGHYADGGKGMCLVIDKKRLISRIESYGCFYGPIDYAKKYDSSIIIEGDPQKYISNNAKEVFFTKSDDWKYEREFRVVQRSLSASVEIDISDCIIAVIVHHFGDIPLEECTYNSPSYICLVNRLKTLNIPILSLSENTINGQYSLIGKNHNREFEDWLLEYSYMDPTVNIFTGKKI